MRFLQTSAMIGFGVAALWAAAVPASAQVTQDMTCAQAQKTFENRGRVQTRTRSGTVLTISGGVPVSRSQGLICGRNGRSATVVVTTDNKRCVIARKCG
jgi:hypothetical protein